MSNNSQTQYEPVEMVEIDVPQIYQGVVMQELGKRFADIKHIEPNETGTQFHFTARMPTRALFGLKTLLITSTKGTVIMNNVFDGYEPMSSYTDADTHGSMISTDTGTSSGYSLDNAQQRGTLFIGPATDVYAGMVIGQCSKDMDLEINPTKDKKLSNVRSKSSDDAITLSPPKVLTLEEALEYINNDELVEVTPLNIRVRMKFLDPNERKRFKGKVTN
jgi:GTP-binding protein